MTNHDAYVVHLTPTNPPLQLEPGQLVTLQLQIYQFDQQEKSYSFASLNDIFLRLLVNHYEQSAGNCHLPYVLDGYPQDPLPSVTSLKAMRDAVLSELTSDCRLVFRYDPIKNLGCLVHVGYDFPTVDQPPYTLLWNTAMHQRQHQRQSILLNDEPLA